MNTPNPELPQSVVKPATIKVIGIGGAGANVLAILASNAAMADVQFMGIDTDHSITARVAKSFLLGQKLTRGLGCGGDPEVGRAAALAQQDELKPACGGSDLVILIGGLGGGLTTGAMPLIAQAARDAGALVLAVVTLPFDFEGVRRQRQAQQALQQLKPVADGVICLTNQGLVQLFDQNASVTDVFQQCNSLIAQNVVALWRLATQQGLIKIDFAALVSVTRGRHTESSSATVEASGENRSAEIAGRLFAHPFLKNQTLKDVESILVSFAAGTELTMKEVNAVMDRVNESCPNSNILFGVAVDASLAGTMSVTIIMSHRSKLVESTPHEKPRSSSEDETEDATGSEDRRSRFSAPAPTFSDEGREKLLKQKGRTRPRKKVMMQQGQLPLEIVSRGRFEKSEPTIHQGQDLDVPTYLRKNIALN